MLKDCVKQYNKIGGSDFNIGIGRALIALADHEQQTFSTVLDDLRRVTARSLSATNTSSLQTCHDLMLRFHVLTEIDTIGNSSHSIHQDKNRLMTTLDRRLDLVGPFLGDKQYILGLRRAAMLLCK